jgi:hypothetical protein
LALQLGVHAGESSFAAWRSLHLRMTIVLHRWDSGRKREKAKMCLFQGRRRDRGRMTTSRTFWKNAKLTA